MRSQLRWIPAALLIWVGCPGRADAHLVHSGLGPFYDGVAHLLVTPEDLLVVVAMALLAGLMGKSCGRSVLFLLPFAWLAGSVAGGVMPSAPRLPFLTAGLLIAVGALVAIGSNRTSPKWLVDGLAITVGAVHGLLNGATLVVAGSGGLAVAGICCAIFVITTLVSGQVASFQQGWTRTVVRVAGSWIGAIGLLLLGWAAR
jgi:hypothetical protein